MSGTLHWCYGDIILGVRYVYYAVSCGTRTPGIRWCPIPVLISLFTLVR